jgi:hypothetical protein
MCDRERDELDIEFFARYDYIAELTAEHAEDPATLRAEAEARDEEWQAEQDAFIGPRQPYIARVFTDDDIPF